MPPFSVDGGADDDDDVLNETFAPRNENGKFLLRLVLARTINHVSLSSVRTQLEKRQTPFTMENLPRRHEQ